MTRRILFVLLALVSLTGCGGSKRLPPLNPSIASVGQGCAVHTYPIILGVGLAENKATMKLQSTGKCFVLDADDESRLGIFTGGSAVLLCQAEKDGIGFQWDNLRGKSQAIILQPADVATHVLFGGEEYKGEFQVVLSPNGGGLTLINTIELETYLQGVLPWEIGRPGPDAQAALEAQAVAARTYTVSKLGSRSARGFDVVATIYDQVYRGCKDEADQCNKAIAATRGIVLQSAGTEINAYYSSCCGGMNSQIEEVWPRDAVPYLRSHRDAANSSSPAFCSSSGHFRWQEKWTVKELQLILQKTLPQYMEYMANPIRQGWAGTLFVARTDTSKANKPGKLLSLDIQKRTSSGRVALLEIVTDAGAYYVRGDRVRWVLPPASGRYTILRSAAIDIELHRQGNTLKNITINGRGNGHGLGMCQTGALEMARQGYLYQKILGHYYMGAILRDLRPKGARNGR